MTREDGYDTFLRVVKTSFYLIKLPSIPLISCLIKGKKILSLGELMAREFVMFFIVISIWFHWIFVILRIFLMLIQQKRGKSTLSFGWQEISHLEGNQRRLLQIKPIGATFLKRALSTGAPEWKTAFHTTARARLSGRLECPQPLLVYTSNFCEGTTGRREP